MNLFTLAKKFPNEDAALLHLIRARWPHGVRCLACDHDHCWLIEAKGKTGKPRKLFQCAECGLQFSATTNTLFHDSHLPLTKWFAAISLIVEAKKGISANQVMRHIGMTYKTAWYVCHRVREAMQEASDFTVGGPTSVVEIDEMFVGGRKRNAGYIANHKNKTVVLGLAERSGNIHMQVIPNAKRESIQPVVSERLDKQTDTVITDGKALYKKVLTNRQHVAGNHAEELKDKNYTSTYTVESAFSLFKRGLIGSYHWLSAVHLDRYLREFCWRFNRRRMQLWLFDMTLTNMLKAKPLPYKVLTYEPF